MSFQKSANFGPKFPILKISTNRERESFFIFSSAGNFARASVGDTGRVEDTSMGHVRGLPDDKENRDARFDDSLARVDIMGTWDGRGMSENC